MNDRDQKWWPWVHLNLRGDPNESKAIPRGQAVFVRTTSMRPLVAMVDSHLCALAEFDRRIRFLLELLAVEPIQTHLYADNGAPHRLRRQVTEEIEYVPGWINTIATDNRFLEVAYVKDGEPTRTRSSKDMSAYRHVHPSIPVDDEALDADFRIRLELDATAMLTAAIIQADLFITDRPLLLELEANPWTRTTVLEPSVALPIIGLYLRQQGRFVRFCMPRVGQPYRDPTLRTEPRNEFYWYSAKSLLPSEFRWSRVCRNLDAQRGTSDMHILSRALIQRISQALQCRDRLLAAMSVPQDNDTADDALTELDQFLVWLMAAFDITARVAHGALGLTTKSTRAGWQIKDWRREVKTKCPPLWNVATSFDQDGTHPLLTIVSRLRNTVHGPALSASGTIPVVGENAFDLFVELPTDSQKEICKAIDEVGGQALWGVSEPLIGYGLHIHPGQFIEQLLQRALKLLNDLMVATPFGRDNAGNQAARHSSPLLSPDRLRTLWQLGLEPLGPVADF